MERNIKLLQIILPLEKPWFWLGIWLLFYLTITDYAGVGIIEAVVVTMGFLLEVPTGAFADLIGKKRTLILSYVIIIAGNIVMGLSTSVALLVTSVILLSTGHTLYSGTAEALLYDSLKTIKQEDRFEKLLSNVQKYMLIIMAVATVIGGFLYDMNKAWPFFATAAATSVGLILLIFIKEPPIDTEKFSITNYLKQTRIGVKELFKDKINNIWISKILVIAGFSVILMEVMDPALMINFGYNEQQMGIIFALVPFISAIGAHFYPQIRKFFGNTTLLLLITISFLFVAGISPFIGFWLGGALLLFRNIFYPMIDNLSSSAINKVVESKYRATALSAFTMFKELPYVASAYLIGVWMDQYTPVRVTMWLAVVFSIITLVAWGWQYVYYFKRPRGV